MKTILLAALIAISGVSCGPISISDNNVGDIVNVGLNVEAEIKSEINIDIVNILVALLANIDLGPPPPYPPTGLPPTGLPPTGLPPTTLAPPPSTTVEPSPFSSMQVDDMIKVIEGIKQQASDTSLTKDQKEQIWRKHAEQFVQQLMKNRH